MKEKNKQPWEKSEIEGCEYFNMQHVGGSGKPDCLDKKNDKIAEIKHYNRNFNSYDLKKIVEKRWTENKSIKIGVINNCTENAIRLADTLPNVDLICNLREILNISKKIKK